MPNSDRHTRPGAGSEPTDRPSTGLRRGAPPPRGSAARPATLPDPYRYTIADLAERTDITPRTIRYYIQEGLLSPAHGRGPSATYDLGHLGRLQAIALLKNNHLPLEAIRDRLAGLSDREIQTMLEIDPEPQEDLWRRIQLHPDLELHVRERPGRPRDYKLQGAVETIRAIVRDQLDPDR
ncbi:MAG: MerR family transcriptional regulator [Thermomicrobiales bacterium]|nr:MerR family transcriptional regulator [Thermomicrobiales bacterium]